MIEPTPKNVITARLIERNNYSQGKFGRLRKYRTVRSLPIVPSVPSLTTLFETSRPWWTHVDGDNYIPEAMLMTLLSRKEIMKEERANTFSVFWETRVRDLREATSIELQTVSPKQKFSFFEEIFARAIMASIVDDNSSRLGNVNKIGYRVREEVDVYEMNSTYQIFLASLAHAYAKSSRQEYLTHFLSGR